PLISRDVPPLPLARARSARARRRSPRARSPVAESLLTRAGVRPVPSRWLRTAPRRASTRSRLPPWTHPTAPCPLPDFASSPAFGLPRPDRPAERERRESSRAPARQVAPYDPRSAKLLLERPRS